MKRREFLKYTGVFAGFSIVPRCAVAGSNQTPPSEKLNIAFVGAGGRGQASLKALKNENNVAMCDVDLQRAAKPFADYSCCQKVS